MLTDEGEIRRVALKCESDIPPFEQRVRMVDVEREDDSSWYGRPSANPSCPVLRWPKYAWKEVLV